MLALTRPRAALRSARLLPLAAIVIAGVALRFYRIGEKSLWLDESFSVWMGARPLGEMWRDVVRLDQHPPLYYTLLHLWMALGDSEAVVRGFSALWSALTLPVVYLIGVRIGGRGLGLLAALILALAPMHTQYAQDARMYAMLTFNASMALLCMVYLLEIDQNQERAPAGSTKTRFGADGSRLTLRAGIPWIALDSQARWWLGLIVFTTLTMLSHNTAILFAATLGVFIAGAFGMPALLRRLRSRAPAADFRLRNWTLALGAALLLWLPWLPGFLVQSRRVYDEFWIPPPTLSSVADTWRDFCSAFGPSDALVAPLLLAFAALALLGAWRLRRKPALLTLLLLLILTPFAGELLVSIRRPIYYTRTLIWASIPFYLLLAAGLLQLRFRPLIAVVALALALLNAQSLNTYYRSADQEGWRAAAVWMAPRVQAGDLVLFNAGWVQIPFDYYYRRTGPPVDQYGLPADLFKRGILEPKMALADVERLNKLIAGRRRVWLVYSHNWYTDPHNIIPRSLGAALDQTGQQEFNGLKIYAYERE
jgi:mannosyltransferase